MAWIKRRIHSRDFRLLFVLPGILFALPLGWGVFTGISLWLSPFVLLNSTFVLKSFVWLNILAVIPLVLIFLKKRAFCRYICPLGWACDRISSARKGRGLSIHRVPPVGRWLALSSLFAALAGIPLFILLDPLAIFNSFFMVFSKELTLPVLLSLMGLPLALAINIPFPGIWCGKLCPLGGLQDEIFTIQDLLNREKTGKQRNSSMAVAGRRFFLASGAGLLAALFLPSFLKPGKKSYLKPPGSLPVDEFNTLCLRCGSCIKSCPTGILMHHTDPSEMLSWMVPELRYTDGYCLERCNMCSRVCPSGAITLFDKDAKSQLYIGVARIDVEACLLTQNRECDRCKMACPYDAITIEAGEGGAFQMQPRISEERCVGCGACEVICPPRVITTVPYR
jgi:ferredoxin-type protein NapF